MRKCIFAVLPSESGRYPKVMTLLNEIASIRAQVQECRAAFKANGAAAAQYNTREAALQELEARLDDLWQSVQTGSIDEPTSAGQLDAPFLDYVRVAMGNDGG